MDWSLCPWDFQGKYTGVGCHFLFQGIFRTQGSDPHLAHCRRILYHWATWEAPWLSANLKKKWNVCKKNLLILVPRIFGAIHLAPEMWRICRICFIMIKIEKLYQNYGGLDQSQTFIASADQQVDSSQSAIPIQKQTLAFVDDLLNWPFCLFLWDVSWWPLPIFLLGYWSSQFLHVLGRLALFLW